MIHYQLGLRASRPWSSEECERGLSPSGFGGANSGASSQTVRLPSSLNLGICAKKKKKKKHCVYQEIASFSSENGPVDQLKKL